ncbi:MAG: response regulator transcription factor [Pyrinomonadaceae bacterium]
MMPSLTASDSEGGSGVTTVFIIAASAVVRAGLETLVGSDGRFTVTGSAADWAALTEAPPPDVALLELSEASGVGLAELLASEEDGADYNAPALVILMADLREERMMDALGFGVRAALPRNSTSNEILAAIEAVAAGLIVIHRDALDALREANTSAAMTAAVPSPSSEDSLLEVESLTPREVEVLGMLAEGLGNKEIASRLRISDHTVKFHVSSIFAKLNVSSRTEAVTQGIRRGLIML